MDGCAWYVYSFESGMTLVRDFVFGVMVHVNLLPRPGAFLEELGV